jgi:pentatricopeptide repeat protein
VTPNQYLYNNIISKLAKARKADYALELFQQMKANKIVPTSITYGAVIGACSRVGDAHSAEVLFAEMVQARNFRPRVPPYNTMMQLYTATKPNRERALFFYDALRQAGVSPTAYTYKVGTRFNLLVVIINECLQLLMDAYGIVEPVDIDSMERVFQDLQNDRKVEVQGSHFASLINAYGCVQKDLDKAIAAFDSIPLYPRSPPPDAVVFEAMFNVLVTHRRTDLIPEYISRMSTAGVHMTAYIANCLIKGYAVIGDLEQARTVFESLSDPPEGIAAPNNHIPHEPGQSLAVNPMEPVYREVSTVIVDFLVQMPDAVCQPSTWETMVRAELGSGNRDRAVALLERLQAR